MKQTLNIVNHTLRRVEATPIVNGQEERRSILLDMAQELIIDSIQDLRIKNRNLLRMAFCQMVIIVVLMIWLGKYIAGV